MSAAMKKARPPETIHSQPNANPHLWTNQPDAEAREGFKGRGTDINLGA
jgi:hypothetical protein